MKHITKPQLHELLIYTALWLVIFTALPAGVYLKTAGNEVMTFRWTDVYKLWYDTLPFFILFLIHNFSPIRWSYYTFFSYPARVFH